MTATARERESFVDRMEACALRAAVVPLTREHVEYLKPRVRIFDEDVVREHYGLSGAQMLEAGFANSAMSWAGLIDGLPICAFGLNARSLMSGEATPWLVAIPDEVARHRLTFWRHSREVVAMMLEHFPRLVAQYQANFEASRKWLERLGFVEVPDGRCRVSMGQLEPKAFAPGIDFVILTIERN